MAEQLSGLEKSAILLLAMGDKFTSEAFKRMERSEITQISKVIMELDAVPKETIEMVLREFHYALVSGQDILTGGEDAVKRLLMKNLDGDTAKYIIDELNLEVTSAPFRELGNVSPRILSQILRNEHPQTLALILGHMPSEQAAVLLTNLPAGVRTEVLMRLANL